MFIEENLVRCRKMDISGNVHTFFSHIQRDTIVRISKSEPVQVQIFNKLTNTSEIRIIDKPEDAYTRTRDSINENWYTVTLTNGEVIWIDADYIQFL